MSYEVPEYGACVYLQYDQSADDEEQSIANAEGEVAAVSGSEIIVESGMCSYEIDCEEETLAYTVREERQEYPLLDLHEEGLGDVCLDSDDLPDYTTNYEEDLDDVTGAIDRANVAIGMVHAESDASWVYASDALNAADVYENGIEQRIDDHNEVDYGEYDRATIVFPSNALALMWIEEICGQISDGAWENEVRDWEQYYGAEVVVDESNRNVEVEGDLPPLDFSEKLREYEGLMGRMMFYVLASGVENEYSRGAVDEAICMRLQNGFVDSY